MSKPVIGSGRDAIVCCQSHYVATKKIKQSLNKFLDMLNLNQSIPLQEAIANPYNVSFIFRFVAMLLACARGHVLWRFSTASTKKYCLLRYDSCF